VAVAGGACLDLVDLASRSGADVLVTSDAKHHRAQEAPVPVVDVAHWAGEWPWTRALGDRLRAAYPQMTITVSGTVTDPFTQHRAGSAP
jgi:putative NIF3 family GTP cyclohydrolase 1 type 2